MLVATLNETCPLLAVAFNLEALVVPSGATKPVVKVAVVFVQKD